MLQHPAQLDQTSPDDFPARIRRRQSVQTTVSDTASPTSPQQQQPDSPRSPAATDSLLTSTFGSAHHKALQRRRPEYKSRLQDLEQIHDKIRRRLAAQKGLSPTTDDSRRFLASPASIAPASDSSALPAAASTEHDLHKSLNTADTNYSDLVSSYTLDHARQVLAPPATASGRQHYKEHDKSQDCSASDDSGSTLGPANTASGVSVKTPATDYGSSVLALSHELPVDGSQIDDDDMAKKARSKKALAEQQDGANHTGDSTHESSSDEHDSFASADEQEKPDAPSVEQNKPDPTPAKDSSLDVEPQPAFAQTRSMVDVTLNDDDIVDSRTDDPATPKQNATPSVPQTSPLDQTNVEKLPPLEIAQKDGALDLLPSLPPRPEETEGGLDDLSHPPSPPKRKFTSPFSFFSRGNPKPAGLTRTDTMASTASVSTANNEDGVESENEATPRRPNRQSLRDRFKLLRMQEETGLVIDESESSRPGSQGGDRSDAGEIIFSPKEEVDKQLARKRNSSGAADMPAGGPILNEDLPAGTAVGTSTGPSPNQQAVDWDLWQAVVYEGPAAVARSSTDELNKAIAQGIPSAIRGVVWQVLAESKSEELEGVYRELVARGTKDASARRDSEVKSIKPVLSRPQSMADSVASSRLSVQSSTSPASADNDTGALSPAQQALTSADAVAKAQAKLLAEQKQKQKDEAAALQKLERAIKRDMGARTSYSKFLMSQGLQDGLFGICKAYALYDEDVGYAQGMNFIAMPLLFNMPEEEAFTLFVRLMNQYHLRDLFVAEMPGLHLHLYQFSRLLEDFEPAVYCHLNRRGVHPQLYATQWFLTLFAYRFPLQLVLRIYDLIIAEGLEGAILKFGIVLMQKNAQQLLEMRDMAVLTTFLKERLFDVYIDKTPSANSVLESGFFGSAGGIDREVYMADRLVQDACAVKVTKDMLALYTREWEEKTAEDKAAQLERESLKAQNASLALQVRTLRQRTEQLDNEHVQIASDLVRTKVHNQQLIDDNESLRTNIQELQNIISAQPGEVEDKLRKEMDRIIARNGEVQNQNRALEEEREQVEGELVRAKMDKAEMNAELEALRQKWSHVSGLMNAATALRSPE